MRTLLFALLVSAAAVAQEDAAVPNGPWTLGVGLFGSGAIDKVVPGKVDIALSVAGTYEQELWFVGLEALAAQVGQRSPQTLGAMLRGGFIAPWPIAPFLAFGMGSLQQKLRGDVNADGSGFAVSGEIGVVLFRDRRIGRGTISLMGIEPAFTMNAQIPAAAPGPTSARSPEGPVALLMIGARLLY